MESQPTSLAHDRVDLPDPVWSRLDARQVGLAAWLARGTHSDWEKSGTPSSNSPIRAKARSPLRSPGSRSNVKDEVAGDSGEMGASCRVGSGECAGQTSARKVVYAVASLSLAAAATGADANTSAVAVSAA